tara:strand:- start:1129 stop:1569 length:441 start_codon:yes stop_codon:yes gene_type:complete
MMIFVPSIAFANVLNKLNETGKFTKLNETLTKSGLIKDLESKGPFTVFAPLDDAFAAISAQTYYGLLKEENKDKLVNILGRHIFSKKITSSEIDGEIKLKAINGEEITIKKVNGIVYVNEAEVVTADVEASNGVIHFINRVLQPLN